MKSLRLAVLFLIFVATMSWAQSNPQPLLYPSLVPVSTAPGGAAFSLTVGGYGFVVGAVVQWNGSPRATTFVSSGSLQAAITAADIAKSGTALITVLNPAPGGGISNTVYFPVAKAEALVSVAVDSTLTTPSEGPGFAVADFNGDGILDVVAGISSNEGVGLAFYQGNGNGTFKPPVVSPATYATSYFLVGDFNGDGLPDVMVTGYVTFGESTAVFLNNGDGTFTQQKTFAEGDYGGPAAAGDFNGDGKLDLIDVGCEQGYCNLFYLQGNGDGGFRNSHIIDENEDLGGNVVVGDFNGDGKLDFVEIGSPVLLFLGNGDGTFQSPTTISTISGRYAAAADFNGDGKLDLVITESYVGVCVLLGNGDGTFSQNCTGETQYDSPLFVGDFNGDGNLDLASTAAEDTGYTYQIQVLLGNGDGTFGEPMVAGADTSVSAFGDFNGDGRLDFANTGEYGVPLSLQSPASLSPITINFGSHQLGIASQPQTVTLSNSGASTLKIASLTMTGYNTTDFAATSHCPSGVKPGGTCAITVIFTASGPGGREAMLNVNYATQVPTTQIVELSGVGLTTKASFSPSTLTFPFQIIGTTGAPVTSTLENTGIQTLTITGFTISGAFAYTTNCGSTLAAHATCQVFVTFTPTENYNPGTLDAVTDAGLIPLTLTGTGTELLVSPTSINFGDQAVGTSSAPSTVTLTNVSTTTELHMLPV
jgi:uncharacterized protein (DUF2141 family)